MIPLNLERNYTAVVMGDGIFAQKTMETLKQLGVFIHCFIPRTEDTDPELKEFCANENISIKLFSDLYEAHKYLKKMHIDFLVCSSFDKVLPKRILELPKIASLNIHASPLPKYRGGSPLNWQLISGEDHIVLTIHYMAEKVDSGNILAQIYIPLSQENNYADVIEKTANAIPEAILISVSKTLTGDIGRSMNIKDGFYLPRRQSGDEFIDWNWPANTIVNFVRALSSPGPCARTYYQNQVISFENAINNSMGPFVGIPGMVLEKNMNDNSIVVKCSDSSVRLNGVNPKEVFEKVKVGDRVGINLNMIWEELLKIKSSQ